MIVCTCDICGQVVSEWSVLNINLKSNMWKREVCNNCYKSTVGKLETFIDEITVTDPDDKND